MTIKDLSRFFSIWSGHEIIREKYTETIDWHILTEFVNLLLLYFREEKRKGKEIIIIKKHSSNIFLREGVDNRDLLTVCHFTHTPCPPQNEHKVLILIKP